MERDEAGRSDVESEKPVGNPAQPKPKPKRKYKQRAIDRSWEDTFIKALALTANVRMSCQRAGVSRQAAYDRRKSHSTFRDEWDSAMEQALDRLEFAGYSRALEGNDKLIMFFLSRRRPEQYGDRVTHEHTGKKGGSAIQTESKVQIEEQFDAELLKDPAVVELLDALSERLESKSGGNGGEVVAEGAGVGETAAPDADQQQTEGDAASTD